jgi:hypothetical protein
VAKARQTLDRAPHRRRRGPEVERDVAPEPSEPLPRAQRWHRPDGELVIERRITEAQAEQMNDELERALLADAAAGHRAGVDALASAASKPDPLTLYRSVESTLQARAEAQRRARVDVSRQRAGKGGLVMAPARVTVAESFVRVAQLRYGLTDDDVADALYPRDEHGLAYVRKIRERLRRRGQWIPIA